MVICNATRTCIDKKESIKNVLFLAVDHNHFHFNQEIEKSLFQSWNEIFFALFFIGCTSFHSPFLVSNIIIGSFMPTTDFTEYSVINTITAAYISSHKTDFDVIFVVRYCAMVAIEPFFFWPPQLKMHFVVSKLLIMKCDNSFGQHRNFPWI